MNKEDRLKEVLTLRRKLQIDLGLNADVEGVDELFDIMSEWVANGESKRGNIVIPQAKRKAYYRFSSIGAKVTLKINK